MNQNWIDPYYIEISENKYQGRQQEDQGEQDKYRNVMTGRQGNKDTSQ